MPQENIIFSTNNHVESAIITSNQPSATPIDWLKTDSRSQLTRWTNLDGELVLNILLKEVSTVSVIAIPGHSLPPGATVRYQLYDSDDNWIAASPLLAVGQLIPAGIFEAGTDAFNVAGNLLDRVLFYKRDVQVVGVKRVRVVIDHGYVYVPPVPPPSTNDPVLAVSDGVPTQTGSGIVVIEAENMQADAAGSDRWAVINDSGASAGKARYKEGGEFYWDANSGPSLKNTFIATQSGMHTVYARMKSTDGNSIYSKLNGKSNTRIFRSGFVGNGWVWREMGSMNIASGSSNEVVLSARDHYISVDRIQIQPSAAPAPTGIGDPQTLPIDETTTITPPDASVAPLIIHNEINIRHLIIGRHLTLHNNFKHGGTMRFLSEPDLFTATSGYSLSGKLQTKARTFSINLPMLDASDHMQIVTLQEKMNGKSFLVSGYNGNNVSDWYREKHLFLARFGNPNEASHDHPDHHGTNLILHEV